ncbi:unnamed protein product [Durusdinium trenchii]|uniref:Uncharacterized protein n=1 Tax=Durusdinium trenchii TaxID=1381693 RepID=A0ABP0SMF2_9DINO
MALESVLGQALSRNKAHEKVDLWKEREIQDRGSRCTISLKSRKGDVVRQVTKVPEGAEVTSNIVNQFEIEREANAAKKEDVLLERLANGKDPAWRPDFFLSELKGLKKKGILPKMRPQDYLRMDAAFVQKVVAAYKANKKAEKKKRKKKKKKKEKKEKKEGKKKKEKKEGKEKKRKEKDAGGQGQQVKKEHHEVQKRRSKVVLDDAGQPTCKEELEIVEVRSKVTVRTKKHGMGDEVAMATAKAAHLASKLREQVAAGGPGFQASPSGSTGRSRSSGGSSASSSEAAVEDESEEVNDEESSE